MSTTAREIHSPEPWRHDPADGALIIAGPLEHPVAIAEVFYVGGAEVANARLIAAAPEMSDLLAHMLRVRSRDWFPDQQAVMDKAFADARALLAKIEGKEN